MAKSKNEKIRVHNQGKREYTIPPAKIGGKKRMIQPGRAIEIEKDLAEKMIEAYPMDLIEFDSLISGEKKNLNKENSRLESVNKTLSEENEQFKKDNQALKDKIVELDSNDDPDVQQKEEEIQTLKDEKKTLGDKVIDLEVNIENSGEKIKSLKDNIVKLEEDLAEATKPEIPKTDKD